MADLVLDTTYLLPTFGVGVRLEGFRTLFPRILEEYTVLYNPVSIVEAKWIVLRLAKQRPDKRTELLRRFRKGLNAILMDKRLRQTELTNPEVEAVADILLTGMGMADYFDRLIYATAAYRKAILLTEDEELIRVARREDVEAPARVLRWRDIAKT